MPNESESWVKCMRTQDYAGAWTISDRVLVERDKARRDDPRQPYHLRWVWDGTPPDGRRVLVRCYHGLGDTVQFARFLPAVRARAAHVTLEAQPALCRLLARLPGVDRLVAFRQAAPSPVSECDVEIMELAHVLRAQAADIARGVPYLRVPADRQRPLASRGAGAIGLCWSAGAWDSARSVPLDDLLAACAKPGRRFVSLQRGDAAADAKGDSFVNPGDTDMDVVNSAAWISAVDAVVTVDTMIAHLAGALGRRVLLLLRHDADWRWPMAGLCSPWYPSVEMLHQQRPGCWRAPLAALAEALDT